MSEIGKLYLCATPIGNLGDMTPRCIEILKSVDVIAAEDTRNSIKLLNHFEIHTPMTAYHEFNRYEKADELVSRMLQGESVACITDAGTPGISDPGEVLVEKAIEQGIEVTSIPGACAAVNALIISGLSTRRFRFEAFLPTEKKERKRLIEEMAKDTATLVVYEAPHHLLDTLKELSEGLGKRKIAIIKELTKLHESVFRTTFEEGIAFFELNEPKGEYVIVIEGEDPIRLKENEKKSWEEMTIAEHVDFYEKLGETRKEAMKKAAQDRGISKREIYKELMT